MEFEFAEAGGAGVVIVRLDGVLCSGGGVEGDVGVIARGVVKEVADDEGGFGAVFLIVGEEAPGGGR